VFPEGQFKPMEEADSGDKKEENKKVFKIKYSVNLLAQIGMHCIYPKDEAMLIINADTSLMGIGSDAEELDIFYSPVL
jgi:hypothetical protein